MLLAALLVSTGQAQSLKHLWVLQGVDEIAEYDLASFAAKRTIKVPHRVFEHPEYLSINRKGQRLYSVKPLSAKNSDGTGICLYSCGSPPSIMG